MNRATKSDARRRAERTCREIDLVLRAVVGADNFGSGRRIPRLHRELAARLLGYDPSSVVRILVIAEGDS